MRQSQADNHRSVDLHVNLTLPDGSAWFTIGLDITASVQPRRQ